jgi:hypothetical protein
MGSIRAQARVRFFTAGPECDCTGSHVLRSRQEKLKAAGEGKVVIDIALLEKFRRHPVGGRNDCAQLIAISGEGGRAPVEKDRAPAAALPGAREPSSGQRPES